MEITVKFGIKREKILTKIVFYGKIKERIKKAINLTKKG